MSLTVSVDSSYKSGMAACAYYIKHEKFVVKDTEFLGKIKSSTEAEFQGIIRALDRALNECRYDIKIIYLTNDCQYCIDKLKDSKWKSNLPEELSSDLQSLEINLIPQKVDAHLKSNITNKCPRLYINNWCDINSRNCLNKYL